MPIRCFCFRPLTGILFFNYAMELMNEVDGKEFPSPYGDFVFQLATSSEAICPACKAFPSPYGDFVFQLGRREYARWDWLSFRPLTGILFFNAINYVNKHPEEYSFRPLTGILFFN